MGCAYASQGHMKLLAVSQEGEEIIGSEADLYLEIKEGSGRVFIETFPITKMDTQISTRFAKEIACNYLETDCSRYDFFYTIRGESGIIGGPSAGAAISVLTIAELRGLKIDENVSMTGTINSGGIIGPVGGVKEKIEAAKKAGLNKVLIPRGEILEDNTSIEEYSEKNNITIIEVSTVDEAVYEFTGYNNEEGNLSLEISKEYSDTMKQLAEMLCDKTTELQSKLLKDKFLQEMNESLKNKEDEAINLTIKSKNAFEEGKYYSSASYCFGANIRYKYLQLKHENLSEEGLMEILNTLKEEIKDFENETDGREKRTITDLETYMVVKERIKESKEGFDSLMSSAAEGKEIEYELAYTSERLYSGRTWSEFFGKDGKEYNLSKELLKKSCQDKLAEAEERYQYLIFFVPNGFSELRKALDYAYTDYGAGEYDLCLFKASKAKAEANTIVGTIGVDEEDFAGLIEKKTEIVGKNLAKQTSRGIFPIVGYSYYEYAQSLSEEDKYSAMTYLEYALELGNLDIYFQEKEAENGSNNKTGIKIDSIKLGIFVIGVILGLIIGIFIGAKASKQKTPRRNYPKIASSRGKRGDR